MSVKIRLRRTGKRNAACHRIVVCDSRSPRDGRFIENIGFYDPRHKNEKIDLERVDYWLPRGAQASETVQAIIRRAKSGEALQKAEPAQSEVAAVEVSADKSSENAAAVTEVETTDAAAEAEAEAEAEAAATAETETTAETQTEDAEQNSEQS
ncbi:MAG: 30S ribosomal protein S16 [Lentisphaeria bacterium]|jgi:small subunit ribosomal protein S16|nr:30S ribosomal protein S16 [Lentisphaeria bacterium]NLZ59820.1 30S ribosomal protein S16 [Lentisphaerota bacterium]